MPDEDVGPPLAFRLGRPRIEDGGELNRIPEVVGAGPGAEIRSVRGVGPVIVDRERAIDPQLGDTVTDIDPALFHETQRDTMPRAIRDGIGGFGAEREMLPNDLAEAGLRGAGLHVNSDGPAQHTTEVTIDRWVCGFKVR